MRTAAVVLLITLAYAGAANAGFVTYTNKAAFLADTGATDATGALPNLNAVGPTTLGSVTFSLGPGGTALFIGGGSLDWTTLHAGNDIAISAFEDLNLDLAAPVHALGIDVVEPTDNAQCFAPCFDTTFTITLKNGASTVGVFNYLPDDDVLAFFGVWGDTPFDRVEIFDATRTIDDEYFGQVYTGLRPVPEPASALLLLCGLTAVGFGLVRIRTRVG